MTIKQINRFWNKVEKTPTCWNWQGATMGGKVKYSYGHLRLDNKDKYAHRISWELHFGEIPEGLEVCHRCDNSKCVNPKHLWIGTHQENIRDRDKKGRTARNTGNKFNRKLNLSDIIFIKENSDNIKVPQLAKELNVCVQTVYNIINGLTWKNIV